MLKIPVAAIGSVGDIIHPIKKHVAIFIFKFSNMDIPYRIKAYKTVLITVVNIDSSVICLKLLTNLENWNLLAPANIIKHNAPSKSNLSKCILFKPVKIKKSSLKTPILFPIKNNMLIPNETISNAILLDILNIFSFSISVITIIKTINRKIVSKPSIFFSLDFY